MEPRPNHWPTQKERCTFYRSWALATTKHFWSPHQPNTNQSQSQHMSQYIFKKTKETAPWRPHEALQVYRDSIFGLIWLKSTYYWNHASDQLKKNPNRNQFTPTLWWWNHISLFSLPVCNNPQNLAVSCLTSTYLRLCCDLCTLLPLFSPSRGRGGVHWWPLHLQLINSLHRPLPFGCQHWLFLPVKSWFGRLVTGSHFLCVLTCPLCREATWMSCTSLFMIIIFLN